MTEDSGSDFAIIGMAGRFPGASTVDELWANLREGIESIRPFTETELREAGVDPLLLGQAAYVRAKGVLERADLFDAEFFGISPREAELMDPQHRVFLEVAWEALESSGHDPQSFEGRIGAFAGASLNTYLLYNLLANRGTIDSLGPYQTQVANDKDFLATRACYKLGLTGPGITVQTACSTSLVAVHQACQSLLLGECDMAIAGGVSINVPLHNGYLYEPGGILSPDGHCRPFAADAQGTVIGNGAALVVIRRLEDALAEGDLIDAVIRGSAINNDGSLKAGYTAPSVQGQAKVVAEALGVAEVPARSVGYVETHGTGTPLGDPIEVAALTQAYRAETNDREYCALGSIKSNLGHLDAAAGVAGLIKASMALTREEIPPSLHVTTPSSELNLTSSPFYVNTSLRPWTRGETPRFAGVSSFGIGGTNAHLLLEEPPTAPVSGPSRPGQVFAVSGRSRQALTEATRRLADHLETNTKDDLADVAFTLSTRRRTFDHRIAVVGTDRAHAIRQLREPAAPSQGKAESVAFVFPGQGTQYVDMARDLYTEEPVFREELDRCLQLFDTHVDKSLREVLFPQADQRVWAKEQINETATTQPVLFAIEYALARTLIAWGLKPNALAGHSIGEYVAACISGVIQLEDAVAVVAARGRLVQAMPRGAMLAIFLPEAEVLSWLNDDLSVAAVNGPSLCVVSGPTGLVADLERQLARDGVGHKSLRTSHAFHSRMLEDAVAPLVAMLQEIPLHRPSIPFLSNVTGAWITAQEATDPEYWGRHLLSTVRFADELAVLLEDPDLALVEVGPGQTVTDMCRQQSTWNAGRVALGTLGRWNQAESTRNRLLMAMAALWSAGVDLDWEAHHASEDRRRVRLPSYPFQGKRFWVEQATDDGAVKQATSVATDPQEWTYVPGWRRIAPGFRPVADRSIWVVLGAEHALANAIVLALRKANEPVIEVHAGESFEQTGTETFVVRPTAREDYGRLIDAATRSEGRTVHFVHLWTLDSSPTASERPTRHLSDRFNETQTEGLVSLVELAWSRLENPDRPELIIDVLTDGVSEVTGQEALRPENATLLGPCTVLPQEIPGITCRLLDLSDADTAPTADPVVEILNSAVAEPVLARRGRHWWARTYDHAPMAPADPSISHPRDEGVFLISGGLGGIGLALAEDMTRRVHKPALGLLTRTGLPAEKDWPDWLAEHRDDDLTAVQISRVKKLRDAGARVLILQADVSDLDQTQLAVDRLRSHFGPIHGFIHAAGVPARGLLATWPSTDPVASLAGKVVGALVLTALCEQDPLDFAVFLSSRTAILGGPGQLDYCASNAFLDVFASQQARETGKNFVSIGWDTWLDTGMARKTPGNTDHLEGTDIGQPLLQRLVEQTDTSQTYRTSLRTSESWVVDEHRMMGHGLVPGTTYLELARAAVARLASESEIEFKEVLFTQPLLVPDDQERILYTVVEQAGQEFRFQVRSRTADPASTWQEHAAGVIAIHERTERPQVSAEQIRAACAVDEQIQGEAAIRDRLGLDFAAEGGIISFAVHGRWRCLDLIEVGPHGLLATLELPPEFAGDLKDYALHPALLDVVGGASRVRAAHGYYLPFFYGNLRVIEPMTTTMTCHIRIQEGEENSGETLTCDADIYDPDGRLLVQIRDFVMKRIHDPAQLRAEMERAALAPVELFAPAPTDPALTGLGALAEGGLETVEGVDLFARILAAQPMPAHVIVSKTDLMSLCAQAQAIDPALLVSELEQALAPTATYGRPDLDTEYAPPRGDVEVAVTEIWEELLGVEPIGRNDDFFALGGHSLAAVQIGTKLKSRLNAQLSLSDFFEGPTIARIAELVWTGGGSAPDVGQTSTLLASKELDNDATGLDVETLSDTEVDAMLSDLIETEDQVGGLGS